MHEKSRQDGVLREQAGRRLPIQMTGDAAAYVRSALRPTLNAPEAGGGQTTNTLAAILVQLSLEERTYHNAEFSGG